MVSIIRRFQQPLMITVTILVIIAFAWLYSDTRFMDKAGSDKVGTIYGRPLTITQAQRVARKFDICQDLAMRNMFQGLPVELLQALAITQQGGKENFIWNSMVLRHETDQLGLVPSEDEIFQATQALAAFQTNGGYDPEKYAAFVQSAVTPRGFTADDLGEVIADGLRLEKIQALLASTTAASEADMRENYSSYAQKTEASVVRWKLDDFLASTQVSDEDVKKLYEERKASLLSDELRKVKFVSFILPTTDKPLDGKARAEALSKLAKQSEDFSVAMTEKDAKFADVAAKFGGTVGETAAFARTASPPELAEAPAAAVAAFQLTKEQPNSDVISTDRGYYVLQLADITPPRPLALEEAKDKLADDLKREGAVEALNLKAAEIRNKIEADLKAGKKFAEAAQAAGVTADKYPAFSRQEPQMEPANSGEIMGTASEMNVGELSSPVPTADGGSVIVYVEQRLPIDEEKYKAEQSRVASSLIGFQKAVLFTEWLKLRRAAAQLTFGSRS